jgi:uncharacterized repeat protein (TIGR04138 family)
MPNDNIDDYLQQLEIVSEKHPEYKKEAYNFIMVALHYTLQKIGEQRHVSGQELSHGVKEYAIDQFGPLAKTVFEYWGVTETYDFGKIVYYLIEEGLMNKTDEDSLDDFRDVFDFEHVFLQSVEYDI